MENKGYYVYPGVSLSEPSAERISKYENGSGKSFIKENWYGYFCPIESSNGEHYLEDMEYADAYIYYWDVDSKDYEVDLYYSEYRKFYD